jgi:hypothetical protein
MTLTMVPGRRITDLQKVEHLENLSPDLHVKP